MCTDYLAADLTSFWPSWTKGSGETGKFFPSFCLPWFPQEDPLVGEAARRHRRATDLDAVHPEQLFSLDNRARRHWGEGWLALSCSPDSVEEANAFLDWCPPGENRRVGTDFSTAIRLALEEVGHASERLGLVVPSGLGPGPREQLLNTLTRLFREVQFFPRTVAIALDWCQSEQGQQLLQSTIAKSGERIGSVLVLSGPSDTWELAIVPLRLDVSASGSMLCPVHDRTQLASETSVCGLPWQMSRMDSLASGLLALLLQETLASAEKPGQSSYLDAANTIGSGLAEYPDTSKGIRDGAAVAEVIRFAEDRKINGPLHAVLRAGPRKSDLCLPPWLEHPLQRLSVAHEELGPEAPVRGVAEGMRRLSSSQPPYFEALAPLQLHYWGRNRFRDPVDKWLDLLDEAEVPAGQEYISPNPIAGFSLPSAKEPKIQLCIRTHKRGINRFGMLEVHSQVALTKPRDVRISARLRPGQGLARVEVNSVERGVFDATIREDHVTPIEAPPSPEYEWPPGSAYVVSHPTLSLAALPTLLRVVDLATGGRLDSETITQAREQINKWSSPTWHEVSLDDLQYPRNEVHDLFVYLGVFPSSRVKTHSSVDAVLQELATVLPVEYQREEPLRDKILWFSSWLYARCPELLLDQVRSRFEKNRQVNGAALAFAGNCFTRKDDYRLFFERFAQVIKCETPTAQYWIRAYRNFARFRPDALKTDVLSESAQNQILGWYLQVFNKALRAPTSPDFLHCCYLAPHLLKRRRFDHSFLEPDSRNGERFAKILVGASRRAQSNNKTKLRDNAECALAFLQKRASYTTLQKLSSAETA